MNRPCIGLTMDSDGVRGRFELKASYVDAVIAAGGLPVLIPYGGGSAAQYLSLLDGLVVTGGTFDVPPELYGEARRKECGPSKPERTAFEKDLLEAALASRIPVLGICGGMQLMNVARGGTLYQDLVADLGISGHEQPPPKDVPTHRAAMVPGTLLAATVAVDTLIVNSTHHQAVKDPGEGVVVSARAPDGVIEAIELPELPFAMGVQWHPESAARHFPRHAAIYRGLVKAARDAAARPGGARKNGRR